MKAVGILICTLGILLTGPVLAEEEVQDSELKDIITTIEQLEKKVDQQQRELQRRMNDAEGKVNDISVRLGEGFGRATTFNTIERRLTAVEKKLDDLDRTLRRIESRLSALERKR